MENLLYAVDVLELFGFPQGMVGSVTEYAVLDNAADYTPGLPRGKTSLHRYRAAFSGSGKLSS
jgi:hypothetical protein